MGMSEAHIFFYHCYYSMLLLFVYIFLTIFFLSLFYFILVFGMLRLAI